VCNSKVDYFLLHLPAAEQVNKINIKPSIVMKTRNIFIHGEDTTHENKKQS